MTSALPKMKKARLSSSSLLAPGHNKRLGYGVEQPYGKVNWTASDLMQNVYIDSDQHIIAYWEKRANDYCTLGRIRVHLAVNSHQPGSAINRAMAKRLPEAEQNAIAVLLDSNAILWYNPGITIKNTMLVSDELVRHVMV
ncbi:hypothetical protein QFC20_006045 [Naganishia adeliensis]|uniref:Uncharacterized protein n=1 Tax=Naganishia adeliensis TaxID=92952 RepID=A0ACC2VFS2_9TREE|nr:hypothetical protein QFC20_006045 [Naganishia adeliensis]